MESDNTNLTLTLRDGRKLGYADYGPKHGKVVIHFNGSGCSRLEHPPQVEILDELEVRFISTDRPGHGISDPQENRTLRDWPKDVAELADHLGVDRFYVEGWSAGGAYALVCAHDLPKRVIAGASLSGIAPYERPVPYKGLSGQVRMWMFFCRVIPPLVTPFRKMMRKALMKMAPGGIGEMMSKHGPESDQKAMATPEARLMMDKNIREGYRQGWEGPVQDDLIVNSPWQFELEGIDAHFDIWQGAVDLNVPRHQGEYIHDRLPNSALHILDDEAHLFPINHWKDILESLTRS